MHAAIFWGFVILTIGTANGVAFGLVHAVLGWPVRRLAVAADPALQNVLRCSSCRCRLGARSGGSSCGPARLTLSRDGLTILLLIGGVVPTELLAEVVPDRPLRRPAAGAFAANALAAPLRLGARPTRWRPGSRSAGGLTSRWCARSWATCRAPSTSTSRRPSSTPLPQARAARRAAGHGPRGGDGTFGVKTIEDLSWKDLLDGFTCTECGRCQDACPAWVTGKPLNPKTLIMGIRDMCGGGRAGLP